MTNPQPMEQKQQELSLKEKEINLEARKAHGEVYKRAMSVASTFMSPQVWEQIRTMAKVFIQSHAVPSSFKNEAQIVMGLQAGFEMGMTPIESLRSLYIVNGTISIYGSAVTKRFRDHGWIIKYSKETDRTCTATIEKDKEKYSAVYTYEMAEKSGYTKSRSGEFKVGWLPGANRILKLRYGALSMLLKTYVPEILGSASEIKEVIEDVTIVEDDQGVPEERKTIAHSSLTERLAQKREEKNVQDKPDPEIKEESSPHELGDDDDTKE